MSSGALNTLLLKARSYNGNLDRPISDARLHRIRSNFIATLGYGDSVTIFDRLPRPAFDRFNRII